MSSQPVQPPKPAAPVSTSAPAPEKKPKKSAAAPKEDPESKAISAGVALLTNLDPEQRKHVRATLGVLLELDKDTRAQLVACADGVSDCDVKGKERVTTYLSSRFGA